MHAGQRSILAGDSDDDGEMNTYNYNDSFIDDGEGEFSSFLASYTYRSYYEYTLGLLLFAGINTDFEITHGY